MTSRVLLILALAAGLFVWLLEMVWRAEQAPPPKPYVTTLSSDTMKQTAGERLEGKCVRLEEGSIETRDDGLLCLRFHSASGWPVADFIIHNPRTFLLFSSGFPVGTLHRPVGADPVADPWLWTIDVTEIEPIPPPPLPILEQRIPAAFFVGLICTAMISAGVALFRWRRRKRELKAFGRLYQGRCANCGYDLRASSHRCPECGHALEDFSCGGRTRTHRCVAARG
jgi:hypothetical protein